MRRFRLPVSNALRARWRRTRSLAAADGRCLPATGVVACGGAAVAACVAQFALSSSHREFLQESRSALSPPKLAP